MQKAGSTTMKILIVGLLIILLLIIGLIAYLFVADPYGIISNQVEMQDGDKDSVNTVGIEQQDDINLDSDVVVDQNPILSSEQEKALLKLGVDLSKLPQEVTPELSQCLNDAVGEDRANAILNDGDFPSVSEFNKISKCLQ